MGAACVAARHVRGEGEGKSGVRWAKGERREGSAGRIANTAQKLGPQRWGLMASFMRGGGMGTHVSNTSRKLGPRGRGFMASFTRGEGKKGGLGERGSKSKKMGLGKVTKPQKRERVRSLSVRGGSRQIGDGPTGSTKTKTVENTRILRDRGRGAGTRTGCHRRTSMGRQWSTKRDKGGQGRWRSRPSGHGRGGAGRAGGASKVRGDTPSSR